MINYDIAHHPAIEEITDILCNKTQNQDKSFYRVEVAYFLSKIAACMRATIITKDRGEVPINAYALALATSGYGKGHSVAIIENELLNNFKENFVKNTLPIKAEENINVLAADLSVRNKNIGEGAAHKAYTDEYNSLGAYPFTFDSGTGPAVKQLRQKLLIANSGAINLQIDEIGSNLINNTEVLNLFLELYDQGLIKQKLVKNTADNKRGEELDGKTPTNMLLFGTPVKLLDGGITEDAFYSFLSTGYARRMLFALGNPTKGVSNAGLTPAQVYQSLTNPQNNILIQKWNSTFADLADVALCDFQITVEDDVAIDLISYKMLCESKADKLTDSHDIQKAELNHRYFKALKLAGAFAFIEQNPLLTSDHLSQAIKLVEESGSSFEKILHRDMAHMRIAKYIAEQDDEITHADLAENLPFYKTGISARKEQIDMAKAWGLKNNILITSRYSDDIEMFSGKMFHTTDIDNIVISYSDDIAFKYQNGTMTWNNVIKLCTVAQSDGSAFNFINHHVNNGHRAEADIIEGFNCIVLDVDGGASINFVADLLKPYKFCMYTTKRSTPDAERFRIILPISHKLELSQEDYKEFMNNILSWLPFDIDEASNQRSKKWLTNPNANVIDNDGELLNVLKFIPRCKANETYQKELKAISNMNCLERWFATKMTLGNRNNTMIKYALALADTHMSLDDIKSVIIAFNKKLEIPLPMDELTSTVFVTVGKKLSETIGDK